MRSTITAMFAVLFILNMGMPTHAQTISGTVERVIDGDTFLYDYGVRIRLCGIDAPPRRQADGKESASFLSDIIKGKVIMCRMVGGGTPCDGRSEAVSFNRIVSQCFLDDNDIAEIMTTGGHAKDDFRYSNGYYE